MEQKRGEGKQILKSGQAGSRGGSLKKGGGDWNPLTNYDERVEDPNICFQVTRRWSQMSSNKGNKHNIEIQGEYQC